MLKLYNTLTKKKEILKPRSDKKLKLFVCGITPYDFAHLGHARTYVVFDAFAKYLRSKGYKVFYLQNITDIEDKIIQRAKDAKESPLHLARRFEKEYLKDMKTLGINSVTKYARATEHIPEIILQVKQLLKKGYAYEIPGDGIYYDISKFKRYGQLAHRTKEQAQDAVSRIDTSVKKRNKGDFALWKFVTSEYTGDRLYIPRWESPWGLGRPGWHIEDTAITEKYFGPQYDIHGGGIDLIFPHHEAEIAQMEAISGKKPLVRHWMHTGFLTIGGEKMSKSLSNFITIKDFLKRYSPRVLRLLFLKTHYRSPVDYSEKLIRQTERESQRIDAFVEKLHETRNLKRETQKRFTLHVSRFKEALEDDFNTPKAIAVLFTLIRMGKSSREALDFLKDADVVFNFIFSGEKKEKIPETIKKLVALREQYRKQHQWGKADELRKKIQTQGWDIDDTPSGSKLKKQG